MDAFFYQGDVPEAAALLDMAREALVACEVKNDLDEQTCQAMVDGLVKAWVAARECEADKEGKEDYEERCFDSSNEAERAYLQTFTRHYRSVVEKAFPKYDASGDGVAWWPSGMTMHRGWPVAFISAVAITLGRVEGAHTVATYREMQRLDAEHKTAEKAETAEDSQ